MSKHCDHDQPPSAPGTGYGGGYWPLCPTTVPTIRRPLKASTLYTKVSALYIRASAILGSTPAETPPPQYQPRPRPSFGLVHSPSPAAYGRRHVHSEAFLGLPRRTGSDGTTTPPQYSKDGPLRRPRRYRNRPQGSDMPSLSARRRIIIHVLPLSPLSTIKGKDLGHLEGGTPENTHTHTHAHLPVA